MIAYDIDIHAVAGLLKRYFRELPDPLFTEALYTSFVQVLGMHESNVTTRRMLCVCVCVCARARAHVLTMMLTCLAFIYLCFRLILFFGAIVTLICCCLALSDPEARAQCFHSLLHSLPPVNLKTAIFLFRHLRRYHCTSHKEESWLFLLCAQFSFAVVCFVCCILNVTTSCYNITQS